MALWSRLASFITGGAVASAAAEGVRPVLEPVRQHAWQRNQVRVLDAASAARLRAQGHITDAAAEEEASRNGIDGNRLRAIIAMIQAAPALGEASRMLNREKISRDEFNAALAQHMIPPEWWDGLYDLTHDKLDPVQLANAIHRGLIPDPGLLAVPPPSGEGNVPAYPVYDIDALAEAKADGFDRDRLGVLVGLMGLPMGSHEAAQAVFRGILTREDFDRAIAEGNTRNEWGHAIFEQTRQIPTARDFFENALRGYHDLKWAQEQAKRHGMSDADSLVIYQNQGRPMALTNITKALARGGTFHPEPGEIEDPYMASIVEGNLKPGYYDLARHLVYTYPSAFVIRALAQEGTIGGTADVKQILLEMGWKPDFAEKVAEAWTTTSGGVSSEVKSEQTRLRATAHRSYVANMSDDAAAARALESAGVAAADVAAILAVWKAERELIRAQLSAADIRKAYQKVSVNVATGAGWTYDDAIAALMDRGWSMQQAQDYLNIPAGGG